MDTRKAPSYAGAFFVSAPSKVARPEAEFESAISGETG